MIKHPPQRLMLNSEKYFMKLVRHRRAPMAGRYTFERQNNEGAKRYLTRRPSLEDWQDTDVALYGVGRVVNSSQI